MHDKVNVLLVDDQPAKLLASEEILRGLGENLVKASSAREALEFLLKNEAAVPSRRACFDRATGWWRPHAGRVTSKTWQAFTATVFTSHGST